MPVEVENQVDQAPREFAHANSDVGLGLAQTLDAVAFLPLTALLQDVEAFKTLQDIAFANDTVGALEAFVLGHGKNRRVGGSGKGRIGESAGADDKDLILFD